jgi:hypothetical protein
VEKFLDAILALKNQQINKLPVFQLFMKKFIQNKLK